MSTIQSMLPFLMQWGSFSGTSHQTVDKKHDKQVIAPTPGHITGRAATPIPAQIAAVEEPQQLTAMRFLSKKADIVENPILDPYTGPYGGVPAFDKIDPANFKNAILKGMGKSREEIAKIVSQKETPTFANTLAAYEDSGRHLSRALTIFGIYTSNKSNQMMRDLETEIAPLIAAFGDEVIQNEGLFKRIKAVYDNREKEKLSAEQKRLVEVVYESFVRQGAALDGDKKVQLKEINTQLAKVYTTFSQNQLADEENDFIVIDNEIDLAGLPEPLRAALKQNAEHKKMPGKWVIFNTRSSVDPFLTFSARRDLREKVWKMWKNRGNHEGATDNKPVITQILKLRAQKAQLLGFATHAHWMLSNTMAKSPQAAMDLMMRVWQAAKARVAEEVADMQKIADQEKAGHKIAPWDYHHYSEKVRNAKYNLDENEIKAYLQLDNMREAMFWAANQLYGLEFHPAKNVPVFHSDVSVYEVRKNGKRVGLWYFDPYAREGKRSGAWMNAYRDQENFNGEVTPIVSNNSNFVKGKPGEPVLISWDDANTLFHEFGHALHGLLSSVHYPRLAGTSTLRDFVEFPSQLNEHWLSTPEVLSKFALHYKTGKPMPNELLTKIENAKFFNQGYKTTEYLMSAIYDMRIHLADGTQNIDPAKFESDLFSEMDAPREVVMRHRPTQFGHIFSDDGYSAGYYSYIWADSLTADAGEAFVEAGSYYHLPTAVRLAATIFSVGNTVPPEDAFKAFRGRPVDPNALMRSRGFPVPKK